MVASRREAAITALMSVPGRPGVWTDLVIDNAGLLSTGDYDCSSFERVIHSKLCTVLFVTSCPCKRHHPC